MCRERTKRGALLRRVPYGLPLKITYWPNKTLYQHGKPFRCTYLYLFWACQLCRFRVSALDLKDVTVLPEDVFNVEIPKTFRFNDLNNSRRAFLCCSLPARLIYIWNKLAVSPPFMPINRPTMSFKPSSWFVCTRSTYFAIEPLLFPQNPCYLSVDTSRAQTTFETSTYLEHGVALRVLSSAKFVHYPTSYVFCEQRVIWFS